jgi:hypothetical protein
MQKLSKKVWIRFRKVIRFFTRNPKKLVCIFLIFL